jgi:hypothetical protein
MKQGGASTRQQQFLIPHFFEGFVTIFGYGQWRG